MPLTVKAMKEGFLDRKAIIEAVGKARVAVMTRQGALVRKIAKNSMKRRKGPSAPGEPPHAHVGLVKDLTYFAFDRKTMSLVVGPAKVGGAKTAVPGLLERGGQVAVRGIRNRRGQFVPLHKLPAAARRQAIDKGRVTVRNARLQARPFMKPALEKSVPLLAREWRGAVKR